MQKSEKYVLTGIVAISVVLAIVVYMSGGAEKLIEKVRSSDMLKSGGSQDSTAGKNPLPPITNKELGDIIAKMKTDPDFHDRTIVKDADTSGGGGSGSSGGGSSGQAAACMASKSGSSSGYYIKARLERIETVYNEDQTAFISRTYATADEYDKGNSTAPDLVPEDLLIVGAAGPDVTQEGVQTFEDQSVFQYLYMQDDGSGFSTGC